MCQGGAPPEAVASFQAQCTKICALQLETHEQLNGLIGSKLETPKAVSSYIDPTSNALPDGPLEVSPTIAKNQTPNNAKPQNGPTALCLPCYTIFTAKDRSVRLATRRNYLFISIPNSRCASPGGRSQAHTNCFHFTQGHDHMFCSDSLVDLISATKAKAKVKCAELNQHEATANSIPKEETKMLFLRGRAEGKKDQIEGRATGATSSRVAWQQGPHGHFTSVS
jgi:hypothetical protein